MDSQNHVVKYQKYRKWSDCAMPAKIMITAGVVFLFFLSMTGCVPGTQPAATRAPAPPKTQPAKKVSPAPVIKPVQPAAEKKAKAQAPEKTAKRVIPVLTPAQTRAAAPAKTGAVSEAKKPAQKAATGKKAVSKKIKKAVQPAPASKKSRERLAFHLKKEALSIKEPAAVKKAAAAPKPPIVIYTLPESKKFHSLHRPIKKGESCVSGKCHANKLKENRYVHAPTATGACILCHGDTKANPPYGLLRSGQNLCLTCHKNMKSVLAEGRSVHKPVERNCTGCHNPHSAGSKVLLRESPKTLCITCHRKATPEFVALLQKPGNHAHKPVAEGRCADCHAPHVSNFSHLLKKGPKVVDLCFGCHKEMAEKVKKAPFKHGPIREGLCNACHLPHVSPNIKMLKYYFVEKFYNPFDPRVYSLCFKCHKESVVLNKRTATLTNFRNGDRNLHYLHVNREKGRTCLACHEVHAGVQARKIRLSTPFGDWNIPIRYTKTATGGTCEAACHVEKQYDRVRPVRLEIDLEEAAKAQASTAGAKKK
ncbi:MAG: cytochrome c3 family protein [Desulfobacterales bacterium]